MRRSLSALTLSLLLVVSLATPAFAHATFDVTQLPAGSTQEFTLRVPLERDAVNELVEVLVPGGFTIDACDATDGWDCQQDATQDGDTVVTLSRQPDGPGDAERFTLTMTAPTKEGVYAFPTIQTYDDGEEVAWVNDPGTDRPAPRVQVGDETTEVEFSGEASPHTELATDEPDEEPADATAVEPTPDATTEDAPADAATEESLEESPAGADPAGEDAPSDEAETPSDDAVEGDDATDTADEGLPWVPLGLGLLLIGGGAAFALSRRG